jgi:hypothetical protein
MNFIIFTLSKSKSKSVLILLYLSPFADVVGFKLDTRCVFNDVFSGV